MIRIHAGKSSQQRIRVSCAVKSLTLKAEIREQGYDFGALFTFGQFGEHQKTLPSSALPHSDTLQPNGQVVKERFGDAASFHDLPSTEVLEPKVDKGKNDADAE